MNLPELLLLKFPNANYTMQDDGQGPYIKSWDVPNVLKPTQADLDRWAIEMEPVKQVQDARQNRRNEYPPIGDQLDALYKAMESGSLPRVPEFYDPIKAVKDKYPLSESIPLVAQ